MWGSLIAEFYLVDRGLRHRLLGFSSLGRLRVVLFPAAAAGNIPSCILATAGNFVESLVPCPGTLYGRGGVREDKAGRGASQASPSSRQPAVTCFEKCLVGVPLGMAARLPTGLGIDPSPSCFQFGAYTHFCELCIRQLRTATAPLPHTALL